ncbi:hypothetical protein MMC15_002064 [Xylographa vitiligo]|nr:hypothetical protein [Xylographa vitiligo]
MTMDSTGPYGQIILFGDSITEMSSQGDNGFAFMPTLQNAYMRRLDVINRGFSGYNTAHANKVLPRFMPSTEQARVRIMVIWFGANDACLPGSSSQQHIPLEEFKQNLKDIVNHDSVRDQQPSIILITPPPVDEYGLEAAGLLNGTSEVSRTAEHTKKYADACVEIGREIKVPVLDLWSALMTRAGWKQGDSHLPGSKGQPKNAVLAEMLSDGKNSQLSRTSFNSPSALIGLHFNPEGYRVLFQALMNTIETNWPKDSPSAIPFRFPLWTEAPK